jgi:hypothetical protein
VARERRQLKYLAPALILGPVTLHRPALAIPGAARGAALSNDAAVAKAAGSALKRRGICKSAVYDHAMGLFRSAMGLFRSGAEKDPEKAAAEPLKEQTRTVTAQAEVARREVKSETRPNPDVPGWGQTIGQEIGKAREDHASQE